MIKLKDGSIVEYNQDFEQFFQELLETMVSVSLSAARSQAPEAASEEDMHSLLLREIMDNSILVSHQITELRQHNERLSQYLLTGFVFNTTVMSIQGNRLAGLFQGNDNEGETILH